MAQNGQPPPPGGGRLRVETESEESAELPGKGQEDEKS